MQVRSCRWFLLLMSSPSFFVASVQCNMSVFYGSCMLYVFLRRTAIVCAVSLLRRGEVVKEKEVCKSGGAKLLFNMAWETKSLKAPRLSGLHR